MRLLLLILFPVLASAETLPAFMGGPDVALKLVGQTIFSGSITTELKTNTDTIYWRTNTTSGGTLPIYEVTPPPVSWNYFNEEVDGAIATFDGTRLTFIQNGFCNLLVRYGFADRAVSRQVRQSASGITAPGTNYLFVTNVVGSLAHHIHTNTYSRLTGDYATRRPLWSTRSVDTTNYVRNPSFFCADLIGIEAYPAGNNSTTPDMNGCLVSPRHILSVFHIGSQYGQILFFVNRTNNAVVIRRVIDWQRVTPEDDMTVGLLDQPMPASIVPAAVLTNITAKLPQFSSADDSAPFLRNVPLVAFSQLQVPGLHTLNGDSGRSSFTIVPAGDWGRAIYPGDSGSPCFAIIGNQVAVMCNWTSGSLTHAAGGSVSRIYADIQATMNVLCTRNSFTNETLRYVDLSSYTSF